MIFIIMYKRTLKYSILFRIYNIEAFLETMQQHNKAIKYNIFLHVHFVSKYDP